MRPISSFAAVSVALWSLACSYGNPTDPTYDVWWIEPGEVEGDCPIMPSLAPTAWLGVDDDPRDQLGLTDDFQFEWNEGELATNWICQDRADACEWAYWDDGTQIVHTRFVGFDRRRDHTEGTLELLGTCGPYCGEPGDEPDLVTCEGSASITFDKLSGDKVRETEPDDSCALLDEPLVARTDEPAPVWIINNTSTTLNLFGAGDAGESPLAQYFGGGGSQADAVVGDRFVLRSEDGTCFRAFDAAPDLRYFVVE